MIDALDFLVAVGVAVLLAVVAVIWDMTTNDPLNRKGKK